MSSNGTWQVLWLPAVRAVLKELAKTFGDIEKRQKLARLVRTINNRLRQNPRGVGEIYSSQGSIEHSLAALDFLAIDFAVNTARSFVVVRRCRALLG